MLTQADKDWIKSNRAELIEGRTESITLVIETQTGTDPYTQEPITSTTTQAADVVWKEYSTVANEERQIIGGVELMQGDVKVTFDPTVDVENIAKIERNDIDYTIVTVDRKGLGAVNRYEALVRRVV